MILAKNCVLDASSPLFMILWHTLFRRQTHTSFSCLSLSASGHLYDTDEWFGCERHRYPQTVLVHCSIAFLEANSKFAPSVATDASSVSSFVRQYSLYSSLVSDSKSSSIFWLLFLSFFWFRLMIPSPAVWRRSSTLNLSFRSLFISDVILSPHCTPSILFQREASLKITLIDRTWIRYAADDTTHIWFELEAGLWCTKSSADSNDRTLRFNSFVSDVTAIYL